MRDLPSSMGLAREGFAIVSDVIDRTTLTTLLKALARVQPDAAVRERNSRTYAVRNLLAMVPEVRELARADSIRRLIDPVLGRGARVVRGILFDKTLDANWKVAWHQDLSIAVKRRAHTEGFGPWSFKAGVQHVQPPTHVLEQMLTVRLHLDHCGPENGPLNVLPGSHAHGVLSPAAIRRLCDNGAPVPCHVPAGGALLMRPLLLHASSSARTPGHRRVIHLEFADSELPGGLEWFEDESDE